MLNGDGNLRVATLGKYFRAPGYQPGFAFYPLEPGHQVVYSRPHVPQYDVKLPAQFEVLEVETVTPILTEAVSNLTRATFVENPIDVWQPVTVNTWGDIDAL